MERGVEDRLEVERGVEEVVRGVEVEWGVEVVHREAEALQCLTNSTASCMALDGRYSVRPYGAGGFGGLSEWVYVKGVMG